MKSDSDLSMEKTIQSNDMGNMLLKCLSQLPLESMQVGEMEDEMFTHIKYQPCSLELLVACKHKYARNSAQTLPTAICMHAEIESSRACLIIAHHKTPHWAHNLRGVRVSLTSHLCRRLVW